MDARQQALFDKIQAFRFDGPDTRLRFTARLARENGWTERFAQRVIEEYRRFCFLAFEAGHPATPSEHVDQAWHLHLVYTHSYWGDFCPNVLGKPLHHGPTKGGAAEGAKHDDWYRKTLASYERLFGEAPPADIWPASETRFGDDLAWRRVNWRDNWIVPKRPLRHVAGTGIAAALGVLLVGCGNGFADNPDNPLNWAGPQFLGMYVGLWFACLFFGILIRYALSRGPVFPQAGEPKLSKYDLAYMQGGEQRLFVAATTELVRTEHLKVNVKDNRLFSDKQTKPSEAVEREVLEIHKSAADILKGAKTAKLDVVERRERLVEEGLIVSDSKANLARWASMLPFIALLFLGVTKIFIGMNRDKPVAFLVVLSVICFITILCFSGKPFLTGPGKRLMKKMRVEHIAMKRGQAGFDHSNPNLTLAVALFGVAALEMSSFADLGTMMKPLPGSGNTVASSSGGCTASSGSDGGGSGCSGGGGCGGCGGGGGD